MTYDEFMAGLYAKYHYEPVSSRSFVPNDKNKASDGITFQDVIAMIVDSERILKGLKNRNMARAIELIVQGYFEWEVAKMLGVSLRTIERYKRKIKNIFN